jgi:hypothetical protein
MWIKFEATDATGKVHKRSMSHVYSHCVVILFAAQPPRKIAKQRITGLHRHSRVNAHAACCRSTVIERQRLHDSCTRLVATIPSRKRAQTNETTSRLYRWR